MRGVTLSATTSIEVAPRLETTLAAQQAVEPWVSLSHEEVLYQLQSANHNVIGNLRALAAMHEVALPAHIEAFDYTGRIRAAQLGSRQVQAQASVKNGKYIGGVDLNYFSRPNPFIVSFTYDGVDAQGEEVRLQLEQLMGTANIHYTGKVDDLGNSVFTRRGLEGKGRRRADEEDRIMGGRLIQHGQNTYLCTIIQPKPASI